MRIGMQVGGRTGRHAATERHRAQPRGSTRRRTTATGARRAGAAAVGAAVGTLLAAPAAWASTPQVQTNIASTDANPGGAGGTRLVCPSGNALGGGVDTSQVLELSISSTAPTWGPDSLDELNFQPENDRIGAPVGWSGGAKSYSSSFHTVRVAVMCADTPLATQTATETADPGLEAHPRALCAPGEGATGGGLVTTNLDLVVPSRTAPVFGATGTRLFDQPLGQGPAPSGWEASARNEGTYQQGPRDVTVAAICSSELALSTVVVEDTAPPGNFGVERALCPEGAVAVGGGVDPESSITADITNNLPVFDVAGNQRLIARPDGLEAAPVGWQASVLNSGTSSVAFKVAAVCLPEPSPEAGSAAALASLALLARTRRAGARRAS